MISLPENKNNIILHFNEEKYKYTLDNGKVMKSVTTKIHEYFEPFDPDLVIKRMMSSLRWYQSEYYGKSKEEIKAQWDEERNTGTKMHKCIEKIILGNELSIKNLEIFSEEIFYYREYIRDYEQFEYVYPEMRIFNLDKEIAGTVDLISWDNEGNVRLTDWKRSKQIRMKNDFQKGKSPFDFLDDCNYNHYSLQLNFYRKILETEYTFNGNKLKVEKMTIAVFHPKNGKYIAIDVPFLDVL